MLTEILARKPYHPEPQSPTTPNEYLAWQRLAREAVARQNPWHTAVTDKIGGLAWIDQQMSFDREVAYLNSAEPLFLARWQEKHPLDSLTETETAYHALAQLWLQSQITFFLTEFGAGKNLQIQPPYYLIVEEDKDGLFVSAANTRYFGDVASRFRDFDSDVGQGLEKIYARSQRHPDEFLGIVVSPTEKYREFGSSTDVINYFAHAFLADSDCASNETLVLGCYLILNEILSNEQRAFIRNALACMTQDGHIAPDTVRLDAWLSSDESTWLPTTPDIMVQHPHTGDTNPFIRPSHFMQWLSDIFSARFGKSLIKPAELGMYGYIEWLVNGRIEEAYAYLKEGRKEDYYHLLRLMLFESQAVWKLLAETTDPVERKDLLAHEFFSKVYPDETLLLRQQLIANMANHLWLVRSNKFPIGGIHASGELLLPFWDPVAQDWFGGDVCSAPERDTCTQCGRELKDHKCPRCGKKDNGRHSIRD